MNKSEIFNIIQEAFDALHTAEMLDEKVIVKPETVLLGNNSVLDSISFITLFSEIEDRLSEASDNEIYLILSEIHDFNPEEISLNVSVLSDYILQKFFPNA
jgi:acyl carrier protein